MRVAYLVALVVIALALLWGAGELHRLNCVEDGRTSCSILPWDSGSGTSSSGEWQTGSEPGW